MHESLKIIKYPDPRLKAVSKPVTAFDDNLKSLAARLFELMRDAKGVGLAAPQVGVNLRLFVINPDGEPDHDEVIVNPILSEGDGEEVAEEGCLSLPKLYTDVYRSKTIRLQAFDIVGNPIDRTETGYVARIWQHETDHLDGLLLTDRMGPMAKITHRKLLQKLRDEYEEANPKARKQARK